MNKDEIAEKQKEQQELKKSKPFWGQNHGTDPILAEMCMTERMPVEIHLKENGAEGDKPSMAIVSLDRNGSRHLSQISVDMFNEGLMDIGYQLIKV